MELADLGCERDRVNPPCAAERLSESPCGACRLRLSAVSRSGSCSPPSCWNNPSSFDLIVHSGLRAVADPRCRSCPGDQSAYGAACEHAPQVCDVMPLRISIQAGTRVAAPRLPARFYGLAIVSPRG